LPPPPPHCQKGNPCIAFAGKYTYKRHENILCTALLGIYVCEKQKSMHTICMKIYLHEA
jgi:hypothetical protein